MSAASSNTSGTKVANVGFWPKGLLQNLAAGIKKVSDTFKRVLSGELDVLAVDFIAQSGTEKIPNDLREEIARFLVVTLEKATEGNVVFATTPPEDKSKVWWQIDPATSIPIGSPKLWNATTGAWEPINTNGTVYVPPLQRKSLVIALSGNSTITTDFTDIGTVDYRVTLTPTIRTGGVAPAVFPNAFGWCVLAKTTSSIVISFYAVPTEGLEFELDVEARPSAV